MNNDLSRHANLLQAEPLVYVILEGWRSNYSCRRALQYKSNFSFELTLMNKKKGSPICLFILSLWWFPTIINIAVFFGLSFYFLYCTSPKRLTASEGNYLILQHILLLFFKLTLQTKTSVLWRSVKNSQPINTMQLIKHWVRLTKL